MVHGSMTAGLVLGLLLIVGAGVASVLSLYARGAAGAWVSHTLLVRELLTTVHTRMHEAEAAQRGYIITGDEDYLQSFNEALQQIGPDLDRLEHLTAAKPQQQDRTELVRSLAHSRLEILKDGIAQYRAGGFEAGALIIRTGRGKAVIERIRAALGEFDEEESRLQAEREAVARQRERWLVASTVAGSGLGVLLVTLTSVHAWRSRRSTAAAYEQLRTSEQQLRSSEIRYRTLFESIDEGFCIIEMIFDDHGKPTDYRFLEISPSFERQTGLVEARGKTMRELAPRHEEHWFETYGAIALTGQPARFQHRAEQLRRWYDVYAFRFGRPEDRPPPAPRRLRILFVEDHGDTAEMLTLSLAGDGHEVEQVGDVATALETAGKRPFDLLISDLGLPDASGLALMRELRRRGLSFPGIALSGYGQEEDIRQSREAGFVAHLVKPASPAKLADVIARVTGKGASDSGPAMS